MTVGSPSVSRRVFPVQAATSGVALPSRIALLRVARIALSVDAKSGDAVGTAALANEVASRYAIAVDKRRNNRWRKFDIGSRR